jgi:uncharacterized membrane protein
MPNPQSMARIAGYPIHPMLSPFPVAFFVSALVCDLVFWQSGMIVINRLVMPGRPGSPSRSAGLS